MAFKLRLMVDMHGIHTHGRFDDIGIDGWFFSEGNLASAEEHKRRRSGLVKVL